MDERERQRACRQRRAAGGAAREGCHAPPSCSKPTEVLAELLESFDEATALSRATLVRKMPRIIRELLPAAVLSGTVTAALSRATLGP